MTEDRCRCGHNYASHDPDIGALQQCDTVSELGRCMECLGPTVRYTCGNWEGDPYEGHHTGPCGSRGYVDVPVELELTGGWRDWLMQQDDRGWSITAHHCNDATSHEVNAGSRFHNNRHEMIFCCGPCMFYYLASLYFSYTEVDDLMEVVRSRAS